MQEKELRNVTCNVATVFLLVIFHVRVARVQRVRRSFQGKQGMFVIFHKK